MKHDGTTIRRKWPRMHADARGCWVLVLLGVVGMAYGDATPPAGSAASAAAATLDGSWQDGGNGTIKMTQDAGGGVSGTWSQRADETIIKVGDAAIDGKFDGKQFTGQIHLKFKLPWSPDHPGPAHTAALTMTLSADGNMLSGQYQGKKIDKDGNVTDGDMADISLQRVPDEIKKVVIGPDDGDL